MSKNSLEYLYLNHLKLMMENNIELQKNLCEDCYEFNKKINRRTKKCLTEKI